MTRNEKTTYETSDFKIKKIKPPNLKKINNNIVHIDKLKTIFQLCLLMWLVSN